MGAPEKKKRGLRSEEEEKNEPFLSPNRRRERESSISDSGI